jgi:hypothetical protein
MEGAIVNLEKEKCAQLQFFPLQALPHTIIEEQAAALKAASKGKFCSEKGWSE